ncbi:hypothetical protein [Streptomyces sp. R41]|uniref:Uncharacterized protein n=1 Tax=Streptomyces sp. R41 TaxID=3238632 RepID=A0AB39RKV4_9ACTN
MERRPRRHDGLFAVLVGLFDVLLLFVLGYGLVVAGISFGAPDQYEVQRTADEQHGILVFSAWLAGGGFVLAAVLRLWKTGVVHLLLIGAPLLAYLAWQH